MDKKTPQADLLRLVANDLAQAEPLDRNDERTVKRCTGSILATATRARYKKIGKIIR